jgi:hypothetical protein
MPGSAPLDALPLSALFLVLLLANLLFDEGGFRVGRLRAEQMRRESDAIVGAIVTAELGLLAFLLAFSFELVSSRFDFRRRTVLDEANAIGTAYLRASTLPDAQRRSVQRLLRDYTDDRLLATTATANIDQLLRHSKQLQQQLWIEAVAAAEHDPRSVPTGLFMTSLNNVIDLHATRVMASLRNRMPLPVWIMLFVVGFLSFFTMGYQAGLTKASRSPATLILALTFGAVLCLVADLDRPAEGFLRVNQEPMIEVRKMMDSAPPADAPP